METGNVEKGLQVFGIIAIIFLCGAILGMLFEQYLSSESVEQDWDYNIDYREWKAQCDFNKVYGATKCYYPGELSNKFVEQDSSNLVFTEWNPQPMVTMTPKGYTEIFDKDGSLLWKGICEELKEEPQDFNIIEAIKEGKVGINPEPCEWLPVGDGCNECCGNWCTLMYCVSEEELLDFNIAEPRLKDLNYFGLTDKPQSDEGAEK